MTMAAESKKSFLAGPGPAPSRCSVVQAPNVVRYIQENLRFLKGERKRIQYMELIKSRGESLIKEDEEAIHNKPIILAHIKEFTYLLALCGLKRTPSALPSHNTACCISSQVEPRDVGRYLCVSFGFMICCLDLKKSKLNPKGCLSNLPPLPVISTIELLNAGFPVSMGMFKVNSDAYMVGGQEFPHIKKNPSNLWDWKFFELLYERYGWMGSCCETYHLSRANESLSLNECDIIGPLNKPKIWPTVEKIGDKIHVFETLPVTFCNRTNLDMPGSVHEVLDLKDLGSGWMELTPKSDEEVWGLYMWNHIVVGDRIFASPLWRRGFAVFHSETSKWELQEDPFGDDPYSIKHVAELLRFGWGRCVGKFEQGMYVLIALVTNEYTELSAVAYLVTRSGQILCFQRIRHFFREFRRPFKGTQVRVIDVDGHGKTKCAIFQGMTLDTSEDFLFICTFEVDVVANAKELAGSLKPRIKEVDNARKLPFAQEERFVNVTVKDTRVYKREIDPKERAVEGLPGLSACFL